jgi:putative ABC transport system permease protein
MNIVGVVNSLGHDLRYALRSLSRRPAFTFAAVLTLALGIGATTAIFSVVYSVLIKPLPYPNADELVRIKPAAPGLDTTDLGTDVTMLLTYRDESRTFADIGLWSERSATLTDGGEPERVPLLLVTDGTLQALGVQPMRGRWFTDQETFGPPGAGQQSVILSHAFWQRRFGGDEAMLGRELTMEGPNSGSFRVVGIMPRSFRFLDITPQPDVFMPLRIDPTDASISNFSFSMLARLKPGATPAEAHADVERMLPIWLNAWPSVLSPEALASWQITSSVRPLKDDLAGSVASTLWVLMGAIGAVLLIACANIANLLLVRAAARRHELAVRVALGAGRARIAREFFVESLVLGAAGGVLGGVLASLGVQILVAIGPNELPRLEEIAVHPAVLAFTVAISLASTLVFGSITAIKAALHVETPLGGLPRGSSATRERSATRSVLVVVQVALALVLVVSAALMIRTFQTLRDIDPGFARPETIQTARIWIPSTLGYNGEQGTRIQHEILDTIAALPGVASVGFADDIPMARQWDNMPTSVEGETIAEGETPPYRRWNYVSPGFFGAMGTRIVAGRDVTWSDLETGSRVVLISEDFARDLAPEPAAALGRRVRGAFEDTPWYEVIGVVQNVHHDGLYEAPTSTLYWPVLTANRFWQPDVTFAIRSERAGTASLTNEVRRAVGSVNGTIPITLEGTMQDLYAESLARTSFTLVMLAIAGSMALALGVIGIYGVISYVVAQRTREIGIRSALGAEPRQLEKMFLLHGLTLSAAGVVVGLIAAAALARAMASLLFGVEPIDPAAYVAAIGVIVVAAALASYLPARRAAKIDPIETLKAE